MLLVNSSHLHSVSLPVYLSSSAFNIVLFLKQQREVNYHTYPLWLLTLMNISKRP